jgi:hypothetical protein
MTPYYNKDGITVLTGKKMDIVDAIRKVAENVCKETTPNGPAENQRTTLPQDALEFHPRHS